MRFVLLRQLKWPAEVSSSLQTTGLLPFLRANDVLGHARVSPLFLLTLFLQPQMVQDIKIIKCTHNGEHGKCNVLITSGGPGSLCFYQFLEK